MAPPPDTQPPARSAMYRKRLPHVSGERLFLTDGGLETTLVFHDGIDLPEFAAFTVMDSETGMRRLRHYYAGYAEIARSRGLGLVLEAPTWRASSRWGAILGYDEMALDRANDQAVGLMYELRNDLSEPDCPMVISGCLGPQDDGYQPQDRLTSAEACTYHATQISSLERAGADMVTAFTMTYPEEAIGITKAAQAHDMPVAISFTVETDGRLPVEVSLREAIETVDAATGSGPAYYMVNCAHPSHFLNVLEEGGGWLGRIGGVRANASRMSHAELDEATELDAGDIEEFGALHTKLRKLLPALRVLGGCCGTDHRHVASVARHSAS